MTYQVPGKSEGGILVNYGSTVSSGGLLFALGRQACKLYGQNYGSALTSEDLLFALGG